GHTRFSRDWSSDVCSSDLGFASLGPTLDHCHRLVQRVRPFVEIASTQAEIDRVGIAFDGEAAGPGHHRRQRLRATHPAETRGKNPSALEIAVVVLAPRLDKRLVGALHNAL